MKFYKFEVVKNMRVIQFINSLSFGDGMSNTLFFIGNVLRNNGIDYKILTLSLDNRVKESNIETIFSIEKFQFQNNDILLYHYGVGCVDNRIVENINIKKVLVFHNVTDAVFMRAWDYEGYKNCLAGHADLKFSKKNYCHAIVLSEFSRKTLIENGWRKEDISIFPLHEYSEIQKEYNKKLFYDLDDGKINFLFTGRIAPHKKIEDIIKMFWDYHENFNKNSRLFLVGGKGLVSYYNALLKFIDICKIRDVCFVGHVSYEDRETYYKMANIFLCASEHEGFCTPLLEAFQREIPVIAYNSTAVPDTMGDAGIIIDKKDGKMIGPIIEKILNDSDYKKEVIEKQKERLSTMTLSAHADEFIECLYSVYNLPVCSNRTTDFDLTDYKTYEIDDVIPTVAIERISKLSEFIVYGYGKIGKYLVSQLLKYNITNMIAICDNNLENKNETDFKILTHSECVDNYSSANYIITVQSGYLDIIYNLISDGISKKQIFLYDNARKRIEEFNS